MINGIFCGDIHLCHTQPVARTEPNWYAYMARRLNWLHRLADQYQCKVVYTGDIFDRWNSCTELVNFAIQHLPPGYAVPGQHDLPGHNYGLRNIAAYGTLELAGVLKTLEPGTAYPLGPPNWVLYGFPWGHPITPHTAPVERAVAVIHRYGHGPEGGHPGVGPEADIRTWDLGGYMFAAVGDNHRPLTATHPTGCRVFGNGTFFPRKSDERGRGGNVALLHHNGTVDIVPVPTGGDQWADRETPEASVAYATALLAEFDNMAAGSLDYADAVRRAAVDQTPAVREILLRTIEA